MKEPTKKVRNRHLRLSALILFLAVMLPLGACRDTREVYERKIGDVTYTVDPLNNTIAAGGRVYTYLLEGGTYTITCPDGKKLYWSPVSMKVGGKEADKAIGTELGEEMDFTAFDLTEILEEEYDREYGDHGPNWPLVIVLFGFGALNVFCTKTMWYLTRGRAWRKYRPEDPSDNELTAGKVLGGILMAVAVILIFIR